MTQVALFTIVRQISDLHELIQNTVYYLWIPLVYIQNSLNVVSLAPIPLAFDLDYLQNYQVIGTHK